MWPRVPSGKVTWKSGFAQIIGIPRSAPSRSASSTPALQTPVCINSVESASSSVRITIDPGGGLKEVAYRGGLYRGGCVEGVCRGGVSRGFLAEQFGTCGERNGREKWERKWLCENVCENVCESVREAESDCERLRETESD